MHELGYEIGEEIDCISFTMNYTVGLYVICIEIKPTQIPQGKQNEGKIDSNILNDFLKQNMIPKTKEEDIEIKSKSKNGNSH